MVGKRKRNWNYEVDEWWKFVQVTGLFGESCDSNTGNMIVNILHCGLKGRFWSLTFILTQLETILCLCLEK